MNTSTTIQSGPLLDALAERAGAAVLCRLDGRVVEEMWTTDDGRIAFRLVDGRAGEVEQVIAWDVDAEPASNL